VHPYMAQGVAQERVADFLRAAEANQKAREGAARGTRRWFGSRRQRPAGRQPSQVTPRLVVAYSGPAESGNEQDRSAELVKAGS
jgi:hypothetical protein